MNHEGYRDETADRAIKRATKVKVEHYDDPVANDVSQAVEMVKRIFALWDFDVVGRITLRSRKNGRIYK